MFADEGEEFSEKYQLTAWYEKVWSFINTALGPDEAELFSKLSAEDEWHQHALRVGHIQGLVARTAVETEEPLQSTSPSDSENTKVKTVLSQGALESRKVFVVHGRDVEAKETVARFIERLGLHPIILHEQPNSGRTIIEKFETYSNDARFAVVLLTPDDLGGSQDSALTEHRPRACVWRILTQAAIGS